MRFHLLDSDAKPPRRFTYPFCYTPHRLCREAAKLVQQYVEASQMLSNEPFGGKMFGVLVCRNDRNDLGFLSAYSGILAQRGDDEYFVPLVFDAQQPAGYFKMRERQISLVNEEIDHRLADTVRTRIIADLAALEKSNAAAIKAFQTQMNEARTRREKRRSGNVSEAERLALERESQYQKAELRRLKKRCAESEKPLCERLKSLDDNINKLRERRQRMSDGLQEWLFRRYEMLNARGERRNLLDIFRSFGQGIPPAGTGDCCAPKLLQYAYRHHYQPLCMAEFWLGEPSKDELRQPEQFYPACNAKCKPTLNYMLQGLETDPNPLETAPTEPLEILFEDAEMVVLDKPSALLSVPGKGDAPSAQTILQRMMGEKTSIYAVHRLDMDTSGLLVFAKTAEAQRLLRQQFERRQVDKTYIAMLQGTPSVSREGTIRLPLRPDFLDRPRQVVDFKRGKTAITHYYIIGSKDGNTLVMLHPQTGRTHQLRVHCAHADGLNSPILGDRLYGFDAHRLHLHAAKLTLCHPVTGEMMTFESHRREPWMTL